MSKPKIPPTPFGYSRWKRESIKDVHIRYFAYTFKDVLPKHIKDEGNQAEARGEVQKFVYDTDKRELHVTVSGHIQSRIIDAFVKMMRESIEDVHVKSSFQFYTNAVSSLFQNPGDQTERYRLVGDLLVTNISGPVFAIETATKHSYPSIENKVMKWFLLPGVTGVLLVHLKEADEYRKPTSRPPEDDVFLINSWAWLNYIVDINDENIDLFDCSKPVRYGGHTWLGSMTCALELYERDFSSKSSCAKTKRYEFVAPGSGFNPEITEDLNAFQERLSEVWKEAMDGDELDGFKAFHFELKWIAKVVARNRLQLAYDRYKAWHMKYQKFPTPSSLGKRRRDGSAGVEAGSQEVFYGSIPLPDLV